MCKEFAQDRELQIKFEEEIDVEKFIDYVEDYFQLTPSDEHNGVRGLYEDFKKQTYNRKTTSYKDSLCMSISQHSNGLAFTIDFKCNRKKQDKRLSNHHFPLHIPQKTKHHYSDPRYTALKWYFINFRWVFGMQLIGGGDRESTKLPGVLNLPWKGFDKKPSQKLKHMQAWPYVW